MKSNKPSLVILRRPAPILTGYSGKGVRKAQLHVPTLPQPSLPCHAPRNSSHGSSCILILLSPVIMIIGLAKVGRYLIDDPRESIEDNELLL